MKNIRNCLWALSLLGTSLKGGERDFKQMLPEWDSYSSEQKESLAFQVKTLDLEELKRQQDSLKKDSDGYDELSTFEECQDAGSLENLEAGKDILAGGKAGCLIVAGGQGSRLNYDHPKGMFPVTLVKKKSFFQLFAEKILAAGKQIGHPLKVAIMTSLASQEETLKCFEENHFFGLDPSQLYFFSQQDLPMLHPDGSLALETLKRIAMGPDGNASSLREFVSSGIWKKWNQEGVIYLNYMHIDNALADPFDAELTGFHHKNSLSDVIVKCTVKEDSSEKVGVLFKAKQGVVVVEYSEIDPEERDAKNKDGSLRNSCANIGLYSFKMDFVYEVATKHYSSLPLHKAWKSIKGVEEKAWKFEKFIFDVLPFAKDVKALCYQRNDCFSPLKNAEGSDSIVSVQADLLKKDRKVFKSITGQEPLEMIFELDPQFYYPTEQLLQKWQKEKAPKESYITP